MAKVYYFPGLQEHMAEQSAGAIYGAIRIIQDDALRHLKQHYPELLKEHGVEAQAVWASFMFRYIADVAYAETIRTIGSEEKYTAILEALSRKA